VTALILLATAPSATAQTQTFTSSTPVALSAASAAAPYPSTIEVAGMGGTIGDVNVTLNGVTLASSNLDLLLVAPDGTATLLSSDVPTVGITGQNWTFDDAAASEQPGSALTGIFKPTDVDPLGDSDTLPDPATAEYGSLLSGFDNGDPNGTWQLYAADSNTILPISIGSIAGWSLQLTTVTGLSGSAPASKDFGQVAAATTSAAQTFTITNVGDAAMTLTSTALGGPDASNFLLSANSCLNSTLDPGLACTIDVAFRPASGGVKSALLALGDDTGGAGLTIPLTGTGLAPVISISPGAVDFGTFTLGGAIAERNFVITNTGTAPLSAPAYGLHGPDATSFLLKGLPCPTLAPGESCAVTAAFAPRSAGTKQATFRVASYVPPASAEMPLTGTAVAAQAPTETGSNNVDFESASFTGPTTVGQPTTLHVQASDDKQPVTGLLVNFGEKLGLYGASACVAGVKKGGSTSFDVPYTFTEPGPHTITVTVIAGGCGKADARTTTFSITVDSAKAARRVARAAATVAGPEVTSKCKNATLRPSKAQAKLLVKALLCVLNEQRKLYKLKPLTLSKKLGKAALAHTRAMVGGKFFAHQGPREAALAKRLSKAKYRGAAGENLAAGASTLASPVAIVNGWMHSDTHRANVLYKRWKTVGIGFLAQFPLATSAQPVATYTADFGIKK
jgi:uncharacterized protein YkwD